MIKNYLKIAWKVFLRRKFFTGISLFGMSVTLTVLLMATALLDQNFGPKVPEVHLQRMLFAKMLRLSGPNSSRTAYPSYHFLKRYVKTLKTPDAVTVHSQPSLKYIYQYDKRIEVTIKYTDEVFWKVYDFAFIEGRAYGAPELERGEHVAVISERLKKELFSGQYAVGRYFELDTTRYRVIGVVEDVGKMLNYAFSEIWVPHTTVLNKVNDLGIFGDYRATVLAHSRADFSKIKAEFHQVLSHVEVPDPKRFDTIFCPFETKEEEGIRQVLGIESGEKKAQIFYFLIISAMILFMTLPAINLINLNMSRIAERSSEIGVRKAFGATKLVLTGQFLVENILLTFIGGAIGIFLSTILLRILTQSGVIPYAKFLLNFRVLVYYLGVTLFFGCFSGVYPAYRMSKLHPVNALTGGRE